MDSIQKLLEVIQALRDPQTGCPWDLKQDFASIAPYTVEEAYEVADAIEREDMQDLRKELGDLLFQVVFHAQLAEELGVFDFASVVDGLTNKMVNRHPHVFGSKEEIEAGQAVGAWEQIKAEERAATGSAQSAMDGVAATLPALKRAQKLGKRASSTGFDWPDTRGVRAKIDEELVELSAAEASGNQGHMREELGDVLFSVVNLARKLDIDPEDALAAANRKFERRFRYIEEQADRDLSALDLDAMEALWQASKQI